MRTLADIPPRPSGILIVGINPAPVSVAAGHYYQGGLGKRLWARLDSIGLLADAKPGLEDEAFARAGHGLTDLVKRPTSCADELSDQELRSGAAGLRAKVRKWKPGLVLFSFHKAAKYAIGNVGPGPGPLLEGVPTFRLAGPYASANEVERNLRELQTLLGQSAGPATADVESQVASSRGGAAVSWPMSQRVTEIDLQRGQIRFPRDAKRFFPDGKGEVTVLLRGTSVQGTYDPRTGPDRERSAVLRVGRKVMTKLIATNERLSVTRNESGDIRLE